MTDRAEGEAAAVAAARLAGASAVCVLTGSGISAESGIPTFRAGALRWRDRRAEDLASAEGFAREPELVWAWYNERLAAHAGAEPNAGHRAIAELEAAWPAVTVVTQNVDSLHRRAGSRDVLELHGSLREARCDRCGARRPLGASGLPAPEIGHACGGRFRPDVVWFGESLPERTFHRAIAATGACDVLLVVGTSGLVYPAAALCTDYASQAFVIEVNPEPSALTPYADVRLGGTAAAVLPELVRAARSRRPAD